MHVTHTKSECDMCSAFVPFAKVGLATDSADMLNEIFNCCRKGGRVGVIGAYAAYTNHLNIGAFMEKGLNMRAGQTPVQVSHPTSLVKLLAVDDCLLVLLLLNLCQPGFGG